MIDTKYLCEVICDAVENYYHNCSNKDVFNEHSVKFASNLDDEKNEWVM